jgi:hypothetical protein
MPGWRRRRAPRSARGKCHLQPSAGFEEKDMIRSLQGGATELIVGSDCEGPSDGPEGSAQCRNCIVFDGPLKERTVQRKDWSRLAMRVASPHVTWKNDTKTGVCRSLLCGRLKKGAATIVAERKIQCPGSADGEPGKMSSPKSGGRKSEIRRLQSLL